MSALSAARLFPDHDERRPLASSTCALRMDRADPVDRPPRRQAWWRGCCQARTWRLLPRDIALSGWNVIAKRSSCSALKADYDTSFSSPPGKSREQHHQRERRGLSLSFFKTLWQRLSSRQDFLQDLTVLPRRWHRRPMRSASG